MNKPCAAPQTERRRGDHIHMYAKFIEPQILHKFLKIVGNKKIGEPTNFLVQSASVSKLLQCSLKKKFHVGELINLEQS